MVGTILSETQVCVYNVDTDKSYRRLDSLRYDRANLTLESPKSMAVVYVHVSPLAPLGFLREQSTRHVNPDRHQQIESGSRIKHYQIISLLGAGGMGEVYLAEDTRLRRRVALKLLPATLTSDMERVRRFKREARA